MNACMLTPGVQVQGIQSEGEGPRQGGGKNKTWCVLPSVVAVQQTTAACQAKGCSLKRPQGLPWAGPLHWAVPTQLLRCVTSSSAQTLREAGPLDVSWCGFGAPLTVLWWQQAWRAGDFYFHENYEIKSQWPRPEGQAGCAGLGDM